MTVPQRMGGPLRTGLLVSVRDLDEARLALCAGVDLLDLKEPLAGPLGPVPAATARRVIDHALQHAAHVPVSMALGELQDLSLVDSTLAGLAEFPTALRFAKLGLAGCAHRADWPLVWQTAIRHLPRAVLPIAVIYADWVAAAAPRPADVLNYAVQFGCRGLLVDTFDKSKGALPDHWSFAQIAEVNQQARTNGLLTVLAGSLSLESIARLLPLAPDYVGVRGAICDGPREGTLNAEKIRELKNLLLQDCRALDADGSNR